MADFPRSAQFYVPYVFQKISSALSKVSNVKTLIFGFLNKRLQNRLHSLYYKFFKSQIKLRLSP